MKIMKSLIICMTLILLVLSLTGCDVVPTHLQTELINALNERIALNREFVDELYISGLIDEKMKNSLNDELTAGQKKIINDFTNDFNNANASASSALASIVAWRVVPEADHLIDPEKGTVYMHSDKTVPSDDVICAAGNGVLCGSGKTDKDIVNMVYTEAHDLAEYSQCESHIQKYLTNTLAHVEPMKFLGFIKVSDESKVAKVVQTHVPALGGYKVFPVSLLSESIEKSLNEALNMPIYVLKPDSNVDPLEVAAAVKLASTYKDAEDFDKAASVLSKYFVKAQYEENGKMVDLKVLDSSDPNQRLISVTNTSFDDTDDPTIFNGQVVNMYHYDGYANFPSYDDEGKLGIDMTICNAGEPVMAIRLREFNQQALDVFKERVGTSDGRYMVIGQRAYLMEYPVGYVSALEEDIEDATKYGSVISRSELTYNFKTKQFAKTEKLKNGTYSNTSTLISNLEAYINCDPELGNDNTSSLVIYGETGVGFDYVYYDELKGCPWNLTIGFNGNQATVSVGRLVLRDYLEVSYAPDIVDKDKLVVFGRKLRITNFEGLKSNPVGSIYDQKGEPLLVNGETIDFYIDDFVDIGGLINSSTGIVKYIDRLGKSTGITSSEETAEVEYSDIIPSEETIKSKLSNIKYLQTKTVDRIEPSVKFPSETIGSSDISYIDDKQLFYGLAIRKDLFNSGLFGGWIMQHDINQNSLNWWNEWLHTYGYNYRINENNLTNYLKGNYAESLTDAGYAKLDLGMISQIQKIYNDETETKTMVVMNTIFKIIGYFLVFYGITLIVAWNTDVNVDFGMSYLGKLTFGQWVAIKDPEELPVEGTTTLNYVSLKNVLTSSFFIVALGLLLIFLPIADVIVYLVELFGGIGGLINKLLTGKR